MLVYAGFRALDDRVDAPQPVEDEVDAVRRGLEELLSGGALPVDDPPFAALAAAQGGELGEAIAPGVALMARSLLWDLERRHQRVSAHALDAQVARIGDAYLHALWVCSGAPGAPPPELCQLSRAATVAHQLRDLEEDLALGYVNVPEDVLQDLGFGHALPEGGAARRVLAPWIASQVEEAGALFARGEAALRALPWSRRRLLLTAFTRKYRGLLATFAAPGLELTSRS